MCVAYDATSSRMRWFRTVANLALVAGLLSWSFTSKAGTADTHQALHGLTGFFLGLSIAMNLYLIIRTRRMPRAPS